MLSLKLCQAFLLFVLTCAAASTHAFTINLEKTAPNREKPKSVTTVILDARPPFEFATGHSPGAISIRWRDFAQTEPSHKNSLDPDFNLLSRKLRYLGIDRSTEVIVAGNGFLSQGDEGRIAWMLAFLGLEKVNLVSLARLGKKRTMETEGLHASAPPWTPHLKDSLRVTQRELEALITKKSDQIVLVDLRNSQDFERHILGAMNIPVKEFVTAQNELRDGESLLAILYKHKVKTDKRIVFYSNDSAASAYITFIFSQMGLNTTNYDGGYEEWTSVTPSKVESSLQNSHSG